MPSGIILKRGVGRLPAAAFGIGGCQVFINVDHHAGAGQRHGRGACALLGLILSLLSLATHAGTLDAAKQAAQSAASSNSNCTSLATFYWEIGNRDGSLVTGSKGAAPAATATVPLYSAGKWLYAAYVAERRGSTPLSDTDIRALTMQAGFTAQGQCNVIGIMTVEQCRNSISTYDAGAVDRFYYGPGHFQQHAVAEMGLGSKNNDTLATEIINGLGGGFALSFNAPQPAGGARTTSNDYAIFLRKLLKGELRITNLLGSEAICTYVGSGCDALSSPSSNDAVNIDEPWHYSLGHWVEDAPGVGDGAFSSPGAAGFYPWVDADLQYYGLLVRNVLTFSSAGDSAKCGRQIRKAFLDTLGPEAGTCGSANGTSSTSYPTNNFCTTGSVSVVDQTGSDGSFNWSCKGYRGGATANCAATKTVPVNGACGSANGVGTGTYTTTNNCSAGTVTTTDADGSDGAFNWTCVGSNGGSNATCSAPKLTPVNGACGIAQGTNTAAYPTTAACATGAQQSVDAVGTDGSFNWTCQGSNGGSNASCAAPKLVSGSCGTAASVETQTYPSANHCATGTVQSTDTTAADNTFNWNCSGSNGGANVSCSAPKPVPVNGTCGTANAVSSRDYPLGNLCSAGAPQDADVSGADGQFNWSCAGSGGGSNAQCAAAKISDGTCGTANTVPATNYPAANLCAAGAAANVDTQGSDGNFNWTCGGSNGGNAASCAAPKQASGSCGPSANLGSAAMPSSGLCTSGTATVTDNTAADGNFDWTCPGSNGGSSSACSAPRAQNGLCGTANTTPTATYPMNALCAAGAAAATDSGGTDGQYNWNCTGIAGGTTANCAAPKQLPVNGLCGAATTAGTSSYPTSQLCAVGTASATDALGNDGSFNWTCAGSFGGSTTGCSTTNTATVSGACGSANGQTSPTMPAPATLCTSGSALITDGGGGDGAFNWQCQGVAGGSSQSCSAPRQINTPPTEPSSGSSGGGGAFGGREALVLMMLAMGAACRRRSLRVRVG